MPMSPSTRAIPNAYPPVNSKLHRSPSHPLLSPLHPARKRRRRSDIATQDQSDPIIGHVTSSGKFKCFDDSCFDLSFSRQADFRRHYDHTHMSKKVEIFCTVEGCTRSRKPSGRSKGRSFGARDDKMREHVRTVHEKVGKKKRDGMVDKAGDEDGEEDYISEEDEREE
jgi:hypothetical protein